MIPMYNTKTFNDIFENASSFQDNYDALQGELTMNAIADDYVALTWQLLSAKYGNSPIANWSEDQFKMKVWQTMFQYGPTWVKRLDVQQTLRGLTTDQIVQGDFSVFNTSLAPDGAPSPEITGYVNQQNTSNRKKNPLKAYNELLILLDTDVTEEYIGKFKKLFLTVLETRDYIYVTEGED